AAANRLFGTPDERPKPETAIEAPCARSATASAGEATTLSIPLRHLPRCRALTHVTARPAARGQPAKGSAERVVIGGCAIGFGLARQAGRDGRGGRWPASRTAPQRGR